MAQANRDRHRVNRRGEELPDRRRCRGLLIDMKRQRIPLRAEGDDLLGRQHMILGRLLEVANLNVLEIKHPPLETCPSSKG
ncbi:MAG: hypothetical protein JRD94_11635 [Deltaproteobacteria bacterium]|nr:hypothetical protein [Deltaproteobacteria bacterium]